MCSVANTRWPVSAAVSAVLIVSRSRISPTRITSGSWRSAALSAAAKLVASVPSSRWLITQRLWAWTNSIGSSIVTMCSSRVWLISSIIAASEVDLPEPVGPVTSTKPRGRRASSCTTGGSPSWSIGVISRGSAERGGDGAALEVGVDTEAGAARDDVGEVELQVVLQPPALLGREDRVDELARVLGRRAAGSPRADAGVRADAEVGGTPAVRWRSEAWRSTTSSEDF